MRRVEKNTEDAAKRRDWRPSFKNDHGNYIVDHGKIMEFCFWISVGTLFSVDAMHFKRQKSV